MKKEFKVGDKVIAYGREWISCVGFKDIRGRVTSVSETQIGVETPNALYMCHPKQCRRLVKKKRREFWIEPSLIVDERSGLNGGNFKVLLSARTGYIHVREVRK